MFSYPFSRQIPFLIHFRPGIVSSKIDAIVHLIGWSISFFFFLYILIIGFVVGTSLESVEEGKPFITYIPAQFACIPNRLDPYALGFYVTQACFVIGTLLLLLLSIVGLLRINWRLLYIQWRSLFYLFYVLVVMLTLEFTIYFLGFQWDNFNDFLDYYVCVGEHPRLSHPPCQKNMIRGFWYYCIFEVVVYSWIGFDFFLYFLFFGIVDKPFFFLVFFDVSF